MGKSVPSPPRYNGGKNVLSPTRTGKWITTLLPYDARGIYCEPFAGMLGVLLQRPPARYEIVNDADEQVITFWRVLRERPDALRRALELTPPSLREYERALDTLDLEWGGRAEHHVRASRRSAPLSGSVDELEVARAFAVVQQQPHLPRGAWLPNFSSNWDGDWTRGLASHVPALAARLRGVQLACEDALRVLARVAERDDAVVYCDPPYAGTSGYVDAYAHVVNDAARARLADVLRSAQGKVAVSGYGDEWDVLGWERHEHPTITANGARGVWERTEVLWTNFRVRAAQERML